jgi:hypothetical protein
LWPTGVGHPSGVGRRPRFEHHRFKAPDGFFFGNARVGDAVEMAGQQGFFIVRRQIAIVRNPNVVVVGDEVEEVFFEVRPRAAQGVHLILPDHLSQREAQLGGAHGPGQGESF